jgi:hypothetical protein
MNSDFGNKPSGTKIQVTKNGDFFEIYIPPYGFRPGLFFIAPSVVTWSSCFVMLEFAALQIQTFFPLNVIFMLLSVTLLIICGYSAYISLFTMCGKTYLRIDQQEIHFIETLFDHKVSSERPEPRNKITQLILKRAYFEITSRGHRLDKPASVTIEIGVESLLLRGIPWNIQHEAEMEWLAFEISEWLDKPLKIIESPVIS